MSAAGLLAGAAAALGVLAAGQLGLVAAAGAAPDARPVGAGDRVPGRRWTSLVAASGPSRHLALAVVAGAVALAVRSPLAALLAALAAGGGSYARERRARGRGHRECESATPALARSLADALRGGASVRSALVAAGADRAVPPALRAAVAGLAAVLDRGAPLERGLEGLARRGGPGLRLLCGTVSLHLESGGALAGALGQLATGVEEARRVEDARQTATAQARATVRVVAALPLLALGGAQAASPGFLGAILHRPAAAALLVIGLVLEVVAVLAARAIVGPSR